MFVDISFVIVWLLCVFLRIVVDRYVIVLG